MTAIISQEEIDQRNKEYWNELCGTTLAQQLGITDSSAKSLAKFDKFYLEYYPYLKKYLFLNEIKNKNICEIGLGYGTVAQLLALQGAYYHGLDITPNAVDMVKDRLHQHNKEGDVRVGSMLECPFPDNYFDYVISIGCFHHTGNMQGCVDQAYRILKPGGKVIVMVYNKFSLRQWVRWPGNTARALINQLAGKRKSRSTEAQRAAYDASIKTGAAAPETEFFSIKEINSIFKHFEKVDVTRENFDDDFQIKLMKLSTYSFAPRLECLKTKWVRNFGLDLYIVAIK